jgi:hypothetical protein
MRQLSRRAAIRVLAAGGGLLGAGLAGGYALRDLLSSAHSPGPAAGDPADSGMQGSMMGDATPADMRTYMGLFSRHNELRRTVSSSPAASGPSPSPMRLIWPRSFRRMWRACTGTWTSGQR